MRKGKTDKRMIKSISTTIDGVKMKSRLEGTMYQLLKDNKIPFKYESDSFILFDSFTFNNDYYARLASGKGDYCNRGYKKVNTITYKPDFVIKTDNYFAIIETKGYATEAYNMRMKMFKNYLNKNNITCDIFVPQVKSECIETIEIIKNKLNGNKSNTKTN